MCSLFDLIDRVRNWNPSCSAKSMSSRMKASALSERTHPGRSRPTMKDDCIYLFHIRDAIQHILTYTEAGRG